MYVHGMRVVLLHSMAIIIIVIIVIIIIMGT
jgi:hypothetical protein